MPESDDPSSDPPPPKSATDPKSTDPKSAADPKSATDHKGIDQKLKSAKHKLEAVQIFDMLGMRSDKVDDPAVEVFGSIFISGFEAAQSKKLIQKEKIKVVVSLGDFSKDDTEKLGIDRHEVIHIQDDKSVDIVKHLDTGIKWIEEALKDKKKVLVHCEAGISRSVTLVTAYAMKNLFRGQPVDKPLEKIREKRLKAEPNSSFRAQLDLYEDMGLKFDSSNSTYKKFLIDIEVLCASFVYMLWRWEYSYDHGLIVTLAFTKQLAVLSKRTISEKIRRVRSQGSQKRMRRNI
ncbi:protein-tyrosine phosphatase-like protein [Jimgerdemannia flammicorona]|uniref:protein-tyrosine-phosphatase n=1 Tax=Jimgerdemannia flammicorona TaxID=994334 RepID=A0A433DEQ6_9FUNG|nr:protein-tyrosine phosphatase-like protein [Jimgerdemannia flammicorona]